MKVFHNLEIKRISTHLILVLTKLLYMFEKLLLIIIDKLRIESKIVA